MGTMRIGDFMEGLQEAHNGTTSGVTSSNQQALTHDKDGPGRTASVRIQECSADSTCGAPACSHSHDEASIRAQQGLQAADAPRDAREKLMKERGYLFDWSLPSNVPDLCRELRVPEYFADDWLQGLPEGTRFKDAWPSLFVARRGTRSGLHIDTFGRYDVTCPREVMRAWSVHIHTYPHTHTHTHTHVYMSW